MELVVWGASLHPWTHYLGSGLVEFLWGCMPEGSCNLDSGHVSRHHMVGPEGPVRCSRTWAGPVTVSASGQRTRALRGALQCRRGMWHVCRAVSGDSGKNTMLKLAAAEHGRRYCVMLTGCELHPLVPGGMRPSLPDPLLMRLPSACPQGPEASLRND